MNVDKIILHNTKITHSWINKEKALEKSKSRKRPSGRGIAYPDMQGRILGHSDVVTDLIFVRIQTLSFKQRGVRSLLAMLIQQNPTVNLFVGRKKLLPNGTSQRVNLYCTKITVVIIWCHMIWLHNLACVLLNSYRFSDCLENTFVGFTWIKSQCWRQIW